MSTTDEGALEAPAPARRWIKPAALAGAVLVVVGLAAFTVHDRTASRTPATDARGELALPEPTPVSTTPEASSAALAVQAGLAIPDQAVPCVAVAIDKDADLRDALAHDPESSRAADLRTVVARCSSAATMAEQFARNVATQAPSLGTDELGCLRDHYAALQPGQLDALSQRTTEPGAGAGADQSAAVVDGLLAACDIDRSALTR